MPRDKKDQGKKKIAHFAIHHKKGQKALDITSHNKDKQKKKTNEEKKREKKKNNESSGKNSYPLNKDLEINKGHQDVNQSQPNPFINFQQQHNNVVDKQLQSPPNMHNKQREDPKVVNIPMEDFQKQVVQKNERIQKLQDDKDNLYENLSIWRQN
uniref:Uncharacterized protein n=1 Tax=Strongyloides stercoralis TaxID=6248 RepID=A0A0K0ECC3_STRER